jgi:hypothetical protein
VVVVSCATVVLLLLALVGAVGLILPTRWVGARWHRRAKFTTGGSLVAIVAIAIFVPRPAKREGTIAAAAPAATPPATPPATRQPDPLEALRARLVRDVMSHHVAVQQPGTGARIAVTFDVSDNLPVILTKRAARRDVARIMQAADESRVDFNSLYVAGMATVVDVYGRERRARVIRAIYERDELRKVHWRTFDPDNVAAIAESFEVAPNFR